MKKQKLYIASIIIAFLVFVILTAIIECFREHLSQEQMNVLGYIAMPFFIYCFFAALMFFSEL